MKPLVFIIFNFLAKVSHDLRLRDSDARWRLDWCGFSTDHSGNLILSSCCTDFRPNHQVNLNMYTPYGLPVNLLDPAVYILSPFNFHVPSIPTQVPTQVSRTRAQTARDTIPVVIWASTLRSVPLFWSLPTFHHSYLPFLCCFCFLHFFCGLSPAPLLPFLHSSASTRDRAASRYSSTPHKRFKPCPCCPMPGSVPSILVWIDFLLVRVFSHRGFCIVAVPVLCRLLELSPQGFLLFFLCCQSELFPTGFFAILPVPSFVPISCLLSLVRSFPL